MTAKSKTKRTKMKRSPSGTDRFVYCTRNLYYSRSIDRCTVPLCTVWIFATEKELLERSFFIIPHTISTNAYKYIVADGSIFRGLLNSTLVTVVGTVVNMLFTTTLAYPLSKAGSRAVMSS